MTGLFHDREVHGGNGIGRRMGYRYRARVQACSWFGRPRFRVVGEFKHVSWRDEGWKGPRRKTIEQAVADGNHWLDAKEYDPRDHAEGYV